MAASLVITKEEIEIFIYQQRERERALVRWWCTASLGRERERGEPAGWDFQSAPK
jgi:hypothetical protein